MEAFLSYNTVTSTPIHHADPSADSSFLFHNNAGDAEGGLAAPIARSTRRRQRTRKNTEEAENQRMTHIAVERNRRRQMNEHLAVLRSLMPECYIQRGDQASIVGGAIDFVKELEQLLQSLEAQKRTLQHAATDHGVLNSPPFAHFFASPQYTWCHNTHNCTPENQIPALADIEVTLIETHANIRILSPKRPGQLFKMVASLRSLMLTILHLNVTSLNSMVLYSLSLKVEEGCNLSTVDDIAAAIHSILSMIEAEVILVAH
ncbi:transcription factor bHLH96-like [Canna indica]|uniref:Transcription factor bHLH96-like n=1 Tax=Canna indica TaxID=4628 RepID=A0AAQ3KX06_9LILI|nr:transcription factor bHLH96-like [Canna indica]